MRAKVAGVTAAFTALASVLNLVKIPAPYLPGFTYQLGDIILVIAFFLFGLKIGFAVVILNMIVSMALNFSLIGVIGTPYYMIAILAMILGAYVFLKIVKKRHLKKPLGDSKAVAYATLFAVITRTLIMLPLDLFMYGFLVAFVSGWSVANSFALITATMPLIILYNVTVPMYVIPTSYFVAKRVPKQIKSILFNNSIV